jgi:hypothetical protein
MDNKGLARKVEPRATCVNAIGPDAIVTEGFETSATSNLTGYGAHVGAARPPSRVPPFAPNRNFSWP